MRFMLRCRILLPAFIFLLGVGTASAEVFKVFDRSKGLTFNYVNDMVRDSSGYVWLATEKGLFRFDGANFIPVASENTPVRLLKLYNDRLYAISDERGCFRLDLNRMTVTVLSTVKTTDLVEIAPGRLLILTEGSITKLSEKGEVLARRIFPDSMRLGFLHCFLGNVLVGLERRGLFTLDTLSLQPLRALPFGEIGDRQDFEVLDDTLYLTNSSSIYAISRDLQISVIDSVPAWNNHFRIDHLIPAGNRNFYFIANSTRIVRVKEEIQQPLHEVLKGNYEFRDFIMIDSLRFFIGTNQGLLLLDLDPRPITSLDDQIPLPSKEIRIRRKIVPLEEGGLLLLGNPFMYRYDPVTGMKKAGKWEQPLSSVDAVAVDGRYYITTEGHSVISWNPLTDEISDVPIAGLGSGTSCYAIAYDREGHQLLVGSLTGLYVYDFSKRSAVKVDAPFRSEMIRVIRQDPVSREWYIGSANGLYCLDSTFKLRNRFSGKSVHRAGIQISDVLFDSTGRYVWVAHEIGVDQLERVSGSPVRILGAGDLTDPKVVSLSVDAKGRIWMPSYNGISVYDPTLRSMIRLDKANGLVNSEFNYYSAGLLLDGRMVFGGLSGYDVITPAEFRFNSGNDIGRITGYQSIEFAAGSHGRYKLEQPSVISFDFENSMLRIFLSSTDIAHASDYSYQYSLDGTNWINANSSYIDIFYLKPDDYVLRIRATDHAGSTILFEPIAIHSTIPFYKTYTYLLLISLVAVFSIVAVAWVIIRSRRKQARDRERISMDLHDEVGTILTRILYMVRSGMKSSDHSLQDQLQEALYSLRVYIHTLQHRRFPLSRLTDEVRELYYQTFRSVGAEVDAEISSDRDYYIAAEVYRDVRLSLFEISTNILKHAGARRVLLRITASKGVLHIFVQDDGQLTDVSPIFEKGHGIRNVRDRFQAHHGKAEYRISPGGHGLTVAAEVPLSN